MKFLHEFLEYPNGDKIDNGYWAIVGDTLYNQVGGYHNYVPSENDEIIEGTWESILAQTIRDNTQPTGWLSPSGEWFGCAPYAHADLAQYVLLHSERELEEQGWVKVYEIPASLRHNPFYDGQQYGYWCEKKNNKISKTSIGRQGTFIKGGIFMHSKAMFLEIEHKTKTPKKNLIKEYFKNFKIKFLFHKWWWSDLYYVFWNAKNRFFYGYSNKDWFDWRYEFAERNIELFKQFRDNSHSLMCKYANPTTLEQMMTSMSQEEQRGFLNTLIECLEDMKDDGNTVAQRLYNKKIYDCSMEERKIIMEARQTSINLFFDTIRARFDDFWD